ncbi:DUF2483 domain-containing protein [Staphylococcus xylosus]|uniref:DUF2483 domain-containing protein n=1 Tax=Staphylococcus xylosus TaxID=1288 RepID=A0A418IPP0_STAXY|nr:DUF2483 family protein [Staphylococcus xylosus]RIN11412.1 DUF2483 domain-containing protein [Staphylococcus xylosus]
MKETVTYLIKHKTLPIYVTNKPSDNNPEISYSTQFSRAREYNGLDEAKIDMTTHKAIKHTHIEDDKYEEIEYD